MTKLETVAVVGSREYPNLDKVRDYVQALPAGTVVVSGGARGVDAVAKQNATRYKGFHIESWEWAHYGKRAAAIRNNVLVQFVKLTGGRVAIFSQRQKSGALTAGSQMVLDMCIAHDVPYEVIE